MTRSAWPFLPVLACILVAGCLQAPPGDAVGVGSDPDGNETEQTMGPSGAAEGSSARGEKHTVPAALRALASPQSLTDGVTVNVTGPIALRFSLTAPGDDECDLTVAAEYLTARLGLSYMAIHQEENSRGTGQGMVVQDSVISAGPIDNRENKTPVHASSRTTLSMDPGKSSVTLVVLYAQPHASDFVANGSIYLHSTCDGSHASLTHEGDSVTTWHAQTLNGTLLISHNGMGLVIDRTVQATFDAEQSLLAAFHSGESIGTLSMQGPATDVVAIFPQQRLITAEGGPGSYETQVDVVGGTGVWGYMVGVNSIEAEPAN